MKLQIALDDLTLEQALSLMNEIRDYVDIIEIGTPFVYQYGMEAVRVMKQNFPDKEVLADMKIMDAGAYESEEALAVGADYVTVLGVTDNLTIKGCVEAAEKYGKEVVVDMICVPDMPKRIAELDRQLERDNARMEEVLALLADPAFYTNEDGTTDIIAEHAQLKQRIEHAEAEWFELNEELEEEMARQQANA